MIPVGFERPEFLWLLLLAAPVIGLAFWSKRKIPLFRRLLALALRLALLVTIVFAIAGFTWQQAIDALGVVFVVDRSASVGGSGQAQAAQFIEAALEHQTREDRAGIVVFGADGMVEVEPKEGLEFHGIEASPSPHQTDISSGLRLGTALLPSDRARRIVLLTDGEQTRGDAAAQALLTAGDDLELQVVTIGGDSGPDVLLEDLITPPRVDEGATFDVRVVMNAEQPAFGSLRLYRNNEYLGEMPVDLPGGGRARVMTFRQSADTAGLYRYRATFEASDASMDGLPQNNQVMSTVQVTGRPRVLVSEGKPSDARHLVKVLEKEGLQVDVVAPEDFPPGLPELRPYAAIFLSDTPAYMLSSRQQKAIQSYVRDLGRGMVMIGGDQSFGVGGYYDSPVEAALPLNMDIEDKTRFPKLGMIHAIDKSCSMGGGAGSKLFLAKEAALQTVELLNERDLLGVIGFDAAASFIVPLEELHDKQRVSDDIASIRPGGGTDIYPALERSVQALANSDAALRHIILLSDGMTSPGAYESLLKDAHDNKHITLTSIGIGNDTDRTTMEQFARWGGGNYYLVTDPSAIPAIFTRETLLASRSFLIEEDFRAAMGSPSELTAGIDAGRIPTLHGYVATSPKERAIVAMVVPGEEKNEPLLAHWRYGLGRSVAWTSDAKGRWASEWVGSDSYTALWGQIARFVVAQGGDSALQLETEIREGQLEITVDAFDAAGGFKNFLQGDARVVAPDLTVHPIELRQVAPGRYRATLPVDQDGSWLVGVALTEGQEVVGQAVEEAVQPYSPEYRSRGAGPGLVAELGRLGQGGVITDPAQVFARPKVARQIPHPLWPWLMAIAAMLLLLDIASRRLDLSAAGPGSIVRQTAVASTGPKFQFRADPRKAPAPAQSASGEVVVDALEEADEPALPKKPAVEVDPKSYAGRLLAARRTARKQLGEDDE
ncbi:MAG: VWA domain-containing protein [Alphaproteobacteria bacterium]|nr:VWA domain-containing protein [Alphaproteobacteria bacterium]